MMSNNAPRPNVLPPSGQVNVIEMKKSYSPILSLLTIVSVAYLLANAASYSSTVKPLGRYISIAEFTVMLASIFPFLICPVWLILRGGKRRNVFSLLLGIGAVGVIIIGMPLQISNEIKVSPETTRLISFNDNPFTVMFPVESFMTQENIDGVATRKYRTPHNYSPFLEVEFLNSNFGVLNIEQLKHLAKNYMKLCGVSDYEMEYLWDEEDFRIVEVKARTRTTKGEPALSLYRIYIEGERMLVLIVTDDKVENFDELDRSVFETVKLSIQ